MTTTQENAHIILVFFSTLPNTAADTKSRTGKYWRLPLSIYLLYNLCRATSGGYINFGCSREVLFLRGSFQW